MKHLQNTFYSKKHSSITVLLFFSVLFVLTLLMPLSADEAETTITGIKTDFITDLHDSTEDNFFDNYYQTDNREEKESHRSVEANTVEKPEKSEPENKISPLRYALQGNYSIHKGAKLYTGISHHLFGGFIQLESPLPAPYLQFSLKNFAIFATPLADIQQKYPEKPIPHLVLATGSISFNRFLKTMRRTGFSNIRANYTGIKEDRKIFIGIGKAEKRICYGAELAGKHWNTAFFAVPEKKQRGMQYGIYGSGNFSAPHNTAIRLQHITAFLPEITEKTKELPYRNKYQRYHTISGLGFTTVHPNIAFDAAGVCSVTANRIVSGTVKTELDFFYRYAGFNTGFSYTHQGHFGWDATTQKERISTFVQPKLQFKPVVLHAVYAFYLKEKKNHVQPFHTYGVSLQTRHPNIRWYAGWEYTDKLHTVKTHISIISSKEWFSGVRWFEKTQIGTQLQLENKSENPMIIKKYTVKASSTFAITNDITCGVKSTIGQTAQSKKKRTTNRYWKPVEYGGTVFFVFKKHGINKMHRFKLKVSGKNRKPFYDISIGYTLISD